MKVTINSVGTEIYDRKTFGKTKIKLKTKKEDYLGKLYAIIMYLKQNTKYNECRWILMIRNNITSQRIIII